jgi:hypothetical protein
MSEDFKLFKNAIKVKLTKVEERSDAEVPNNIGIGEYRIGYIRESLVKPIIGMRYGLESVIEINGERVHPGHYFVTSFITEIIDDNNFKTLNSVYKLEIL